MKQPINAHFDHPLRGVAFVCVAYFLLTAANALIKFLGNHLSVLQILMMVNIFSAITILSIAFASGNGKNLRIVNWWGNTRRTVFGLTSIALIFLSLRLLPLADVTTIMFTGPLFITILSIPLLKEKVSRSLWGAVIVGFVGVLIVVGPNKDLLHMGTLVALGAAFFHSLAMITIRGLSKTDDPLAIVLFVSIAGTLVTLPTMLFLWKSMSWSDLIALASCGVVGGAGQYCLTMAYKNAPASFIAPFTYSAIFWSVLIGWFFWNEVLTWSTFIGGVVLIVSGLYILHQERLKKKAIG